MGVWLQVLGWVGSAILIVSLVQTRLLRLRQLNLIASILLTTFNAVIGVWPMVAMNVAIMIINLWHLHRLLSTRHDPHTFEVVEIGPHEEYLRYVLSRHRGDIERFNPDLPTNPADHTSIASLVVREGETVGIVLARIVEPGVAQIDLDYVVPRFRDFTPGEFVYRRSGLFARHGVTRVIAPRRMRQADEYLRNVGFRTEGADRVLELVPS